MTKEVYTVFPYRGKELNRQFRLKDGKLKYLVVGTGRCGTVFMAKLLSSVGISCTHEGIFSVDGIDAALARMSGDLPIEVSHIGKLASEHDENMGVSWFKNEESEIIADSSYMAVPFLNHECLKDTTIIHIIRHPMAVINSFVEGLRYFRDECLEEKFLKEYHEFIYQCLPILKEKLDPISRAALYYIEWNQMIEQMARGRQYYLHRIERPVDKLLTFLGVPKQTCYNNVESNHKQGLVFRHHQFDSIPILPIRDKLVAVYSRYYASHNKM